MLQKSNISVYWVDINKIRPNPYQPRKEFDPISLDTLAKSIRQYGVLQPIIVQKKEEIDSEGNISFYYQLIAGERRLRASKIAGLKDLPVIIRYEEEIDDKLNLELAIIENIQREDLNPVDRALAFEKLSSDFGLKHTEIASKVGKSREYISNSIRLLSLSEFILNALRNKKISEGHARSLLMLSDKKEEQETLFNDIILRGLTVRDTERISRKIAYEKARKHIESVFDEHIRSAEEFLYKEFENDVHIERKGNNTLKIIIDLNSDDDLDNFLNKLKNKENDIKKDEKDEELNDDLDNNEEENLYNIDNFSV